MPVNDGSDIGQLEFRNPEIRHLSRREEDQGTPFWRIVGGVFTALVLYGLLETVVASIWARHTLRQMDAEIAKLEASTPAAASVFAEPAPQPVPRKQPASLPGYFGPVEARASGMKQACIGGFVANRVTGGWNQTRTRCRAVSE